VIEEKMKNLGLVLPDPPQPVANYLPAVRVGNLLFTSGVLPMRDGRLAFTGKLGEELTLEQGQEAARLSVLSALAVVKREMGSLDEIIRVVKLTGHVASAPGFTQQPSVLNGASDLLVAVFGDSGRHARVAIGVAELPLGAPVELDLTLHIRS
jgi:enamine deaminase RidA (YjgF/YER057c/UK114 family)